MGRYIFTGHRAGILLEETGSIGGIARAVRKHNGQRPRFASWRGPRRPGYIKTNRHENNDSPSPRKPKAKK